MGAVDSPDAAAAAHADGIELARNLHKTQRAWLEPDDRVSAQRPDSVPAGLELAIATQGDLLESCEGIELVNRIITGVNRPYCPIGADRERRKRCKWIRDLIEKASREIEAKDIGAAICAPNVAAAHMYVAKRSRLLFEGIPAKVVPINLRTAIESPHFVGMAIILVAGACLDEVKDAGNLCEDPRWSALAGVVDTAGRIQRPNGIRLRGIAPAHRDLAECDVVRQHETLAIEDVWVAIPGKRPDAVASGDDLRERGVVGDFHLLKRLCRRRLQAANSQHESEH